MLDVIKIRPRRGCGSVSLRTRVYESIGFKIKKNQSVSRCRFHERLTVNVEIPVLPGKNNTKG